MRLKKQLIQNGFRVHRLVWWLALLALLTFVVSGFLHVLLTWTGPQSSVHRPPQQHFSAEHLQGVVPLLQQHGIHDAQIVKLVPSARGPLLQVTEHPLAPRRYFELQQGTELADYDPAQALWLADHYLQDDSRTVAAVDFQTAFSSEYPWVNRLLPVYRIQYAGDDGLTLFIHTETLALANISNDWKRRVQTVFRQLHTFAWMNDVRHGRVLVLAMLLASLLAMCFSGMALLCSLKRTGSITRSRRLHRVLAHLLLIPLLGFSASGSYRLLYSEYFSAERDFNIAQPLPLAQLPPEIGGSDLPQQALHGVNLLALEGQLYFRASLAPAIAGGGEHDHHQVRQQRFDGVPREQGSRYLPLTHTAHPAMDDDQAARLLAMAHLGLSAEQVLAVERISRFGPGYDFRNKRLPVWKVTVAHEPWDVLFVDVASGVLVDSSRPASRAEGLSFSLLHKWNFLTGPLGRQNRDLLLAVVLGLMLVLAGMGMVMGVLSGRRLRQGSRGRLPQSGEIGEPASIQKGM